MSGRPAVADSLRGRDTAAPGRPRLRRAGPSRDPAVALAALPGTRQPSRHSNATLRDRILRAFEHACAQEELDIAGGLLRCCEEAVGRLPPAGAERRSAEEALILAFERLWFLRHEAVSRQAPAAGAFPS
jgi:hypothetical protein